MNKYARIVLRPFLKPVLKSMAHIFRHAVTPDGYVVRIDPRHTNPFDYLSLIKGTYEAAEIEILRKYFKPAATIIEIGANIGYVARVAMEEKLQAGGCYIAVEPNPRAQEALLANLNQARRTDLTKKFEFMAAAVDTPERANEMTTFIMRPNLSSGLPGHTTSRRPGRETKTNVALTSLSELLQKYAPHGASLICDAEGAEINIVLKDTSAFEKIDQMSIELHDKKVTGREETPAEILMALQKIGFNVGARVSNTYYLSRSPR